MPKPRTISRDTIIDALDLASIEDCSIRDDYSGRAMYGATCFGIIFEDGLRAAMKFFAALGTLNGENADSPNYDQEAAMDLADNVNYDDMGYGKIVYFPGYSLEG